MSIATGDKKISLRVGGKDLTLNEDSRSFLPMRNPEDIPSNLVFDYSNPFSSSENERAMVLRNHTIEGGSGSALICLMNETCEGLCIGIEATDNANKKPVSGIWYNKNVNGDSNLNTKIPGMWIISHRDDGVYIGNKRVLDLNGRWVLT